MLGSKLGTTASLYMVFTLKIIKGGVSPCLYIWATAINAIALADVCEEFAIMCKAMNPLPYSRVFRRGCVWIYPARPHACECVFVFRHYMQTCVCGRGIKSTHRR